MKNRKFIAWGILVSIALAFINAFSGDTDGLYTVAGLGMIVFGIWGAIVLLNYEQ